jgi:hypothetical protein
MAKKTKNNIKEADMSAIKLGRNKTKKEGTMNTMSKTKINLGVGGI